MNTKLTGIIIQKILKKYDNIKLNEKSIEILELIKDNGILNIDEICDNTKNGSKIYKRNLK